MILGAIVTKPPWPAGTAGAETRGSAPNERNCAPALSNGAIDTRSLWLPPRICSFVAVEPSARKPTCLPGKTTIDPIGGGFGAWSQVSQKSAPTAAGVTLAAAVGRPQFLMQEPTKAPHQGTVWPATVPTAAFTSLK